MFNITENFRPELHLATELAEKAGKEIMRFFGEQMTSGEKSNQTPVTEADYVAEKIIVQGLRSKFSYPILSEETVNDLFRSKSEYVWVVDPLDGTRSFIKGESSFAVLIGLTRKGSPLLGVVYMPAIDELYFAEMNKGAYFVEKNHANKIHVSKKSEPSELRIFASKEIFAKPSSLHAFGFQNIDRIGGFSAKAMAVATGQADLYINIDAKGSEWDTCAPEIIVQEAGGKITDVYGKQLKYNQTDPTRTNGEIVSNATAVHDKVIQELIPILISEHPGLI